jgi:hypothetical protein
MLHIRYSSRYWKDELKSEHSKASAANRSLCNVENVPVLLSGLVATCGY